MINIKESFLKLTEYTTPHGKEENTIKIISEILPGVYFDFDEYQNMYLIIKNNDGTNSDVMFASHMDTINNYIGKYVDTTGNKECKKINHVFVDDDFIKTDNNTNLGADDKAGVVLMCNLISENVPGLYYFFIGEECGCVGSSQCSLTFLDRIKKGELPKINKIISLDRRDYYGIITHQSGSRTCSDEFAQEFSNRLNEYGFWFKPDPTGIYTDSAEFAMEIPECTNISVGYFDEHTLYEEQDIEFLEYLGETLTKIDFNTLPVKRNVDNYEYDDYKYSSKFFRKFTKNDPKLADKVVKDVKDNKTIINRENINAALKKLKKDDEFFENSKKSKKLKDKIYNAFTNDKSIYKAKMDFDNDFYMWYNKMSDNEEVIENIKKNDDIGYTEYQDV